MKICYKLWKNSSSFSYSCFKDFLSSTRCSLHTYLSLVLRMLLLIKDLPLSQPYYFLPGMLSIPDNVPFLKDVLASLECSLLPRTSLFFLECSLLKRISFFSRLSFLPRMSLPLRTALIKIFTLIIQKGDFQLICLKETALSLGHYPSPIFVKFEIRGRTLRPGLAVSIIVTRN